jgi:DNA-binding transcriptional regulator YiaG
MLIRDRIKSAREKAGLTQAAASEKWGVNLRTLQDWELGRNEPRSLARTHLEKLLAEILDAPAGARRKRRSV